MPDPGPANLTLLRERHPAAFEVIRSCGAAPDGTEDGFASPVDLTGTRVAELRTTVVFGFGDGSLIEGALRAAPADAQVFVCLLDPQRAARGLAHRDLRRALADPRLVLLAGSLREIASGMPRPTSDDIEVLVTPGLRQAASPELEPLVSMAEELAGKRRSDRRQRPEVLDNVERNLDTILTAPGWASLAGDLEGRSVLVIAPGPSLAEQRELLAGVRLPLVVALDTSLRTLTSWGVRCDLAFTLDPTPGNLKKFEGLSMDAPLAFLESARPEAVHASPAPIFVCEEEGLLDRAHPWFGRRGRTRSGGSVLHAAVDALIRSNVRTVAIAGADLAVDRDAGHVEGARRVEGEPVTREVPARGGGSVGTTESLWRHWRRLRRLIAAAPGGVVTDVTARGASLDPAPRTSLEVWLRDLPEADLSGRPVQGEAEPAPPEAREAAEEALRNARR